MRKNLWFTSLLFFTLLLTGCGQGIKNPLNWEINDFTFTNQEGEDFGLANLKGKVWIADFVFTNCTTVCLPMMTNMAKLQDKLKEDGLSVELVSFSVDPEVDTPEVLKEYAKYYNADLSSWHLLTGYSQKTIEDFTMKNFKTLAKKPETSDQVIHGTSFYLIDKEGKVVKEYSGLEFPIEEIIKDVKILTAKE